MQVFALLTVSQRRISDTKETVKARGPLVETRLFWLILYCLKHQICYLFSYFGRLNTWESIRLLQSYNVQMKANSLKGYDKRCNGYVTLFVETNRGNPKTSKVSRGWLLSWLDRKNCWQMWFWKKMHTEQWRKQNPKSNITEKVSYLLLCYN